MQWLVFLLSHLPLLGLQLYLQTLHTLTARAMIKDWESGLLSDDAVEGEVKKKETKADIINLSKQFSIVTQFTSFVAIEEREKVRIVLR